MQVATIYVLNVIKLLQDSTSDVVYGFRLNNFHLVGVLSIMETLYLLLI